MRRKKALLGVGLGNSEGQGQGKEEGPAGARRGRKVGEVSGSEWPQPTEDKALSSEKGARPTALTLRGAGAATARPLLPARTPPLSSSSAASSATSCSRSAAPPPLRDPSRAGVTAPKERNAGRNGCDLWGHLARLLASVGWSTRCSLKQRLCLGGCLRPSCHQILFPSGQEWACGPAGQQDACPAAWSAVRAD